MTLTAPVPFDADEMTQKRTYELGAIRYEIDQAIESMMVRNDSDAALQKLFGIRNQIARATNRPEITFSEMLDAIENPPQQHATIEPELALSS